MKELIEDLVTQITEYMDEYDYENFEMDSVKETLILYIDEGDETFTEKQINKMTKAIFTKVNKH